MKCENGLTWVQNKIVINNVFLIDLVSAGNEKSFVICVISLQFESEMLT